MRILTVGSLYPPHHLGGYELMWRSSVAQLRAAGHEVRVVTTATSLAEPDPAVEEDANVHRELEWYWRDHAFPRLAARDRLALERHNLEVLDRHLSDLSPAVVVWWAMGGMSLSLIEETRRRAVPMVGVLVDDWLAYAGEVDQWQRLSRAVGPLRGSLERWSGVPARLRFDDAVEWVCVSETVRRNAREAGWRLPRSRVIHAGIDAAQFPPAPEKPWRDRLLFLGRIDERKGIDTAIEALARLTGAELRVVGRGDDAHLADLRRLAEASGVDGRVRFETVPRDAVASAYAEADALLFPARWDEPWGLVPLEAMSVGTPVVATGAGGSGEYLRDEENCLLFRPQDDPAALAHAIERLGGDGALRRELREGGRRTAERLTEAAFNEGVAEVIEAAGGGR